MAAPVLRPLSTGEVLDVSFGLYRALFIPLLTVALASRAIPAIMGIYLQAIGGFAAHWQLGTVQFFIGIFLSAIGAAATTYIVSGAYLGTDVTANDALRQALGLLGRLLLLSLMTSLIIGFGFLLVIVPGMILLSGLALSTVVLVLEAPISPNDAMNRSWQLTKGSRWKVLLTFFVAVLFLMVGEGRERPRLEQMTAGMGLANVCFLDERPREEVAAILCRELRDPANLDMLPQGPAAIKIQIEDLGLCPRYSALAFENVTVKPSPEWLQRRRPGDRR